MTEPTRKFLPGTVATDGALNERQVRVIATTPATDRAGDVIIPGGCILDAYRKNPIVLADHDYSKPVGNAAVDVKSNRVEAVITFASEGASEVADRVCALVKSGVLSAVSVGFLVRASEPIIDKKGRQTGLKITSWELLEISIVAVPANAEAVVVARGQDRDEAHLSAAERVDLRRRQQDLADLDFARRFPGLAQERPGTMTQLQRQVAVREREDLDYAHRLRVVRLLSVSPS